MNESIQEQFDRLFKALHAQDERTAELEQRCAELERRLAERAQSTVVPFPVGEEREAAGVRG